VTGSCDNSVKVWTRRATPSGVRTKRMRMMMMIIIIIMMMLEWMCVVTLGSDRMFGCSPPFPPSSGPRVGASDAGKAGRCTEERLGAAYMQRAMPGADDTLIALMMMLCISSPLGDTTDDDAMGSQVGRAGEQHKDWVRDVAWAPSTGLTYNMIASCGEDGKVFIWRQVGPARGGETAGSSLDCHL
jgi:WD40 repeat protein